jgi:CsoR family transcriptional regulator, copper-sensing transcriptional repressor
MEHLDQRISRLIGQLKGIQKMVKEKRECPAILQQISAIKKAIDGLSKEIIVLYIREDIPAEKRKKLEEMVEREISL